MLIEAKTLEGFKIQATDGVVGEVSDVLFDDADWVVRYFVVSTGSWFNRERVLLSPECVTSLDVDGRGMGVSLGRQQVKDSPDVSSDLPVSRQEEERLRSYYAWPVYWGAAGLGGTLDGAVSPAVVPGAPILLRPRAEGTLGANEAPPVAQETEPLGDPHLRSVREVRGYGIDATDGDIGHVVDVLIDDATWTVHHVAADTSNWWPGRRVMVSPHHVREVRWSDRMVAVDLTREGLKHAPEMAA